MQRQRVNVKLRPSFQELCNGYIAISSFIKTITGVANNAAWIITIDAHEKIMKHPKYKQATKKAFKEVFKLFKQYENNLKYTDINRMFDVNDMDPQTRSKYKDSLTNEEYYEMWTAMGAVAYSETKGLVTSLQWKFAKSYRDHGVQHYDIMGWAMTAYTILNLAASMYELYLVSAEQDYSIRKEEAHRIFKGFSLKHIADAWTKAMHTLDNTVYILNEHESNNIEIGVRQLQEAWTDPYLISRSLRKTTDDFSDYFKNKRALKEVYKGIDEINQRIINLN